MTRSIVNIFFIGFSISLLNACSDHSASDYSPGSFDHADKMLHAAIERKENTAEARGIILFIGDGMSITTITAARIRAGQQLGQAGEEHQLAFEKFPHLALSKTYNTNQQTPDSAGTMTAMVTGSKTKAGVISLNTLATRGDIGSCKGYNLETLFETAEDQGWATGLVTTTSITHATPAANYAHSPERDWESDGKLPTGAKEEGCRDIASQLIEFDYGNGIEVVLGGGRQHFLPDTANGKRQDGRDLTREWIKRHNKSRYIESAGELASIDRKKTKHLLGLFANSHLSFEVDRDTSPEGQPSLTTMVETALDILSHHKRFFLVVEGGRIDHAHHAGNAFRALEETLEFDRAIARATERVNPHDTLMVVTADHSHTLTFAGYPTRGNPILGFVKGNDNSGNPSNELSLAEDNNPYTTLSYANGRGYYNQAPHPDHGDYARYMSPVQAGRHTTASDNPETSYYYQEVNVPLQSETHAGDDVAIYAQGPWAHLLNGVVEQNFIYHVMKHAADL